MDNENPTIQMESYCFNDSGYLQYSTEAYKRYLCEY